MKEPTRRREVGVFESHNQTWLQVSLAQVANPFLTLCPISNLKHLDDPEVYIRDESPL